MRVSQFYGANWEKKKNNQKHFQIMGILKREYIRLKELPLCSAPTKYLPKNCVDIMHIFHERFGVTGESQ